jgi:hypothetical protein
VCNYYRAAVGADADEEDDEATLDEEAALDAAAGRDVKVRCVNMRNSV